MLSGLTVIAIFILYMGILFTLAIWGSSRRSLGKSVVSNPLVYALSLAVYCSSWTFYGSVGLASHSGILFLAIYLGPTLVCMFLPQLLGRLIRLKTNLRITSIADFISARYEKSEPLAALVTLLALLGITPYVALQLKAVFASFAVITSQQGLEAGWVGAHVGPVVVALMIIFTIIFGVRKLDPTERHEGMVMAVAAESLVKLVAFLAVGFFVVFEMFDGPGDFSGRLELYQAASAKPANDLLPSPTTWISYLLLAANAFLFLPRQFHIAMVEAKNDSNLRWAMWLFPLYLIAINLFVFPIAQAGLIQGIPADQADTFVLRLPMQAGSTGLALLVFIGGFSAATSMIMISSMAMSTMISNHLLLPLVDWIPQLSIIERHLLRARWIAVAAFISMGYFFERLVGDQFPLADMGMISFAAVLQLAPAIAGGLLWRGGHQKGAILGLAAGFLVWAYTQLAPALVTSGLFPKSLAEFGPYGISWLRPTALFGLNGLDSISHTVIWSLIANCAFYILGSVWSRSTQESQTHADAFVEMMSGPSPYKAGPQLKAYIPVGEKLAKVEMLLTRYFGPSGAGDITQRALLATGIRGRSLVSITELAEFFDQVERFLSGSIGSATAHRVMSQAELFTPREAEELRGIYAEMLADFRARPQDLKRKIDYYRERESLIQSHSDELQEKVEELEAEIQRRKMAEEHLRDSEERYRMAIEDSTDGVAVVKGYRMIFINRRLPEIFGYPNRGELVHRALLTLVHPDDQDRVQKLNQLRKERMPAPFRFDFKGVKKDGTPIYIAVSAAAHNYGGEVLDLIYMRDVTRRRRAEEDVHRLSRRLIEGIEEERRRLASDLHDEFGQALTGLHMQVESLRNSMGNDVPAEKDTCESLIKQIEQIADNVRSISTELRPDVLDHLGLVATVEWYLEDYRQRMKGVDVSYSALGFGGRKIGPQAEIALYRILQEALNNISKHARADKVSVQLTYSHPHIIMVIKDNGAGFEMEPAVVAADGRKGGIGLLSMRERVASVDGTLDIRSAPGKGVHIRVNIPNQETLEEDAARTAGDKKG